LLGNVLFNPLILSRFKKKLIQKTISVFKMEGTWSAEVDPL
jgi:hypothetical protein